jgi:putative transposase
LRNIYEVVFHLAQSYPLRSICLILGISFSAYYAWVRKESYTQSTHKQTLAKEVKDVFEEHRSRYGAIRISKELQARGIKIGRHQVQTLMKQQDLRAIQPKSYVPKTTNSHHNLGRSPNLLLDRKLPSQPNEVFVGDITYIPMIDGTFLFLATWQDMFSRMMVGWAIDDNMRTELVMKALQKAINHRQLPKGMIVHSDGGSQYASKEFRTLLKKYDLTQSMTRKNNHYDNAMAESLFSRFKAELMQKGTFQNREDAITEIFEYIEMYYNKKRRHSGIDYETPQSFEVKWEQKFNN